MLSMKNYRMKKLQNNSNDRVEERLRSLDLNKFKRPATQTETMQLVKEVVREVLDEMKKSS